MSVAYIGLGSNIEPRKKYLDDAIQLLLGRKDITITGKSSIYETDPVDYTDQNDFLNMVVELETSLCSMDLLEACQGIENKLGRERTIKYGPRTIDLDILLYNNENRELEKLHIPHPRLHERAFVLTPLYEIAPNLVMPTNSSSIKDMLDNLPAKEIKGVRKWKE